MIPSQNSDGKYCDMSFGALNKMLDKTINALNFDMAFIVMFILNTEL